MTLTPSQTTATSEESFDTDVVVVGAGPVGLTLACALGHHGVRYRIFEGRDQRSRHSKANNVWARPQELLASVGVRDALAANAYAISDVNVLLDGVRLDRVAVSQAASPYAEALYTGQDVIETTLEEAIAGGGGRVERGRPVLGFDQDSTGVTVAVGHHGEGDDAASDRVRCRYVVGADGTAGTVREALGLDITPERFTGRATRQIDAKLSWRRSTEPDQLWFFLYHEGFAGVMPIWGGKHRLFFLENDAEVAHRDPTLPEMQARAREVIGDETITLSDPEWFSHGRFQHGVAKSFADGRIFLAGDAGHRTLPIGGQGMNAGMQDAVALAWRLAMTLAGDAGAPILQSYGPERQGEHAGLDEDQAKGFRRLMYRGRLGDKALKAAADVVPSFGSRLFGGDDLQQLTVSYRDSPLSEDHFPSLSPGHRGAPRAGDRAPDARVTTPDGATTTLFADLYNPDGWTWGWSLLAFDGRDPDALAQLSSAVDAVAPWTWVRPRLVLAGPPTSLEAAPSVPVLLDLDEAAHSAYGLREQAALVLLRPDGHLALRGPADRPDLLAQFCRRVTAAGS